jgi:hypothetical protein
MPETLRLGVAWQPRTQYTFAADLVQVRGGAMATRVGGEWRATEAVALRLGWNGQNDAGYGVTVGAGITWKNLRLDYAFVPYGALGDAHRIGATVRW